MLKSSGANRRAAVLCAAIGFVCAAFAPAASAQIFASTLPQARTVTPGGTVTAFASITNGGGAAAANCRPALSPANQAQVTFSYQTTNALNAPTGTPNTSAAIPAGGTQGYVFSITTTGPYTGPVQLDFLCNGLAAPLDTAVNDFFLVSAAPAGPDVIPVAVTPSSDGVIRIDSIGGSQVMAAAAVNIGPSANLTVTPIAIGGYVPVTLQVVQTQGGAFVGAPQSSVTTSFPNNQAVTFTVIATANPNAAIPFQPDTLRVMLRFTDNQGTIRGQTSAAIVAVGPAGQGQPVGFYDVTLRRNGVSNTLGTTQGLAIITSANRTLFSTIKRVETGVAGQELHYNMYVTPTNAQFTGGATGTGAFTSQHVFHDTNAPLLPGAALGLDGTLATSVNYTTGTGWSGVYQGTTGNGQAYSGTSTASYSALNLQNATIADMAGTWTVYDGTGETPSAVQRGTLTVSAGGALSGFVAGPTPGSQCAITGQLTDPATKPDLLIVNNFGLGNCAIAFTATEAYAYKIGQSSAPFPRSFNIPNGDFYAMVFWNLPDNGNTIYLRRQ